MTNVRHEVIDNTFSQQDILKMYNILMKYDYQDEYDEGYDEPSGKSHVFSTEDPVYKQLLEKTRNIIPDLSDKTPYRAYVNMFEPKENTNYHRDGDGVTVLYYINDEFDFNDGGETLFYNETDHVLLGVSPKPGRMAVFDGTILHKATAFKNKIRLTVALKFGN